jgi:hypothetical protein
VQGGRSRTPKVVDDSGALNRLSRVLLKETSLV